MFNEFETKLTLESNWELKYIHIFKGIFIAQSENEYKKGNKISLDQENEFSIEEKTTDEFEFFVLQIKSKKYHVSIRSISRISLEYIIFHSTLKDDKDIGRPLTFNPHLSNIESPLEEKRINENNYRGFINLIIIALILSHLRLMWENYNKYGILLTPKNLLHFVLRNDNLQFISASLLIMLTSIILAFLIVKVSTGSKNQAFFLFLQLLNLIFLLSAPLAFHKYDLINPCKLIYFILVTGVFVLSLVTVASLKLYSYAHFWYDVKIFIKNKAKLIKSDAKSKMLQSKLYEEIEEVIQNYPQNILFKELLKFLVMPVLCFQYKYPTVRRIRKRQLLNHLVQFLCCSVLLL